MAELRSYQEQTMRKWEYCIYSNTSVTYLKESGPERIEHNSGVHDELDARYRNGCTVLAKLGMDGWEMVNAVATRTGSDTNVECYFKRPVE
jgi:hypothetical protein